MDPKAIVENIIFQAQAEVKPAMGGKVNKRRDILESSAVMLFLMSKKFAERTVSKYKIGAVGQRKLNKIPSLYSR